MNDNTVESSHLQPAISTTEIIEEAYNWCRMNGDYKIVINICDLYATYGVDGFHRGTAIVHSHGQTLHKHVEHVLKVLQGHRSQL